MLNRKPAKEPLTRLIQKPQTSSEHKQKYPRKYYRRHLQKPNIITPRSFGLLLPKKNTLLYRITKLLFIIGFTFLGISLSLDRNQTIQLAFFTPHFAAQKSVTADKKVYAAPTHITIPKVGIDLPIEETSIINGVWEVANNGASHLTISARPSEQGPIIMYSHNTNYRFGPIRWLSKGDKIEIKTADDKIHAYTVKETIAVKPDQIDIFTKNKGETLILYTCDGFADLQRFVLIAQPK